MAVHIDIQPIIKCRHPEDTFGEICLRCNDCGRFDHIPPRSDIKVIVQGHPGTPPFWDHPRDYLDYFANKWCRLDKYEEGTLEEMLHHLWHKRDLVHVRWWIEGRNY